MYRGTARPTTNTATMKRIQREIRDVEKEDLGDITLKASEASIFNWTATIPGPEGSVYEGGVFKLTVTLPPDYPFSAPRVTFDTRIYHMNIAPTGGICLDVLKSQWSPALSLFKVMLSISSLLTDPNPKDPLVPAIAAEYLKSRGTHDATAREWTRLYARIPDPPKPPAPAKGKGRALPSQTATPAASNPNSARATPTRPSRPSRASPDIIEISSDVEETTGLGNGPDTPIEIDDDDDDPAGPTLAVPQIARSTGKRAAAPPSPSSAIVVAGTKRRQPFDADEVDGDGRSASGSSTGNVRVTRSTKRRAPGTSAAETIVID